MQKRKYSKCSWCGRTVDITNQDRDLCEFCCLFDTQSEMQKRINGIVERLKKAKWTPDTIEGYLFAWREMVAKTHNKNYQGD